MSVFNKRLKIFSGNANQSLAEEIADYLGLYVGASKVNRFADGEICVAIDESVRGVDVFIIQPTCPPVNENLMELLIMIKTAGKELALELEEKGIDITVAWSSSQPAASKPEFRPQ